MLAIVCPQVSTGRGERLVSERRIVGMVGTTDGFVLAVQCPCGERHQVAMGPPPPLPELAPTRQTVRQITPARRWLRRHAA